MPKVFSVDIISGLGWLLERSSFVEPVNTRKVEPRGCARELLVLNFSVVKVTVSLELSLTLPTQTLVHSFK